MAKVTAIRISLGARAIPIIKEALAHAAEHPGHDPILTINPADVEGRRVVSPPRVSWRCLGDAQTDDIHLCAGGGDHG